MHMHIPTIVWIEVLGVSSQMHMLKSNLGIIESENRPSRGNQIMREELITKWITAPVRKD